VLNIKNGQVGYVSHDELWENEEYSLSEIYAVVSDSIGSFFHEAIIDPNFPVDFYEAIESKNA
jgi:hypothetical protein